MKWDKTSEEYKTLNYELSMKSHFFLNKMLNKIHQKIDEDGRSMQPWKDHDPEFLLERLRQEWEELQKALLATPFHKDAETIDPIKNELIDIANFCFFLYYSLEETE